MTSGPRGRTCAGFAFALLALFAASGCSTRRSPADRAAELDAAEAAYLEARDLADELDIADARAAETGTSGRTVDELERLYGPALEQARALLERSRPTDGADLRAVTRMREALDSEVRDPAPPEAPRAASASDRGCPSPAELVAIPGGSGGLSAALYDCFGERATTLRFEGETLDRLTLLGRLAQEEDSERRRRLFLSLSPLWEAIDGADVSDPAAPHPYRELVRRSAAEWRESGSPVSRQIEQLGFAPDELERQLEEVLEAWRLAFGQESIEPWDAHWRIGRAARELSSAVPRERLFEIHRRFYADLGAEPAALEVSYDLEPRAGKTPVSFCTFGRRGRQLDGAWLPTRAWVFATYSVGGFDNLVELLHETGHAVHLAGIRTRPAYLDWPDSDGFTEGLGDLLALEAYEPEWQERYLGRSLPLADSLRAKYGSIVFDIAWALFEIRLHREPGRAPNEVWTELTARYLGIRPHPEWSWWALRGQLVSSPGYMANYAIGAVLVADLRAEARRQRGPFSRPDPAGYGWLTEYLYRHGRELESRRVIERFLGRRPSNAAILADLARAGTR